MAGRLTAALTPEPPPEGVPAALFEETELRGCDLYTLWEGMTALTQEVRLQGRAFKQLTDSLSQVPAQVTRTEAEARRAAEAVAAANSERVRSARHEGRRDLLEVLLDVRDRLVRGLETAQQHGRRVPRVGWLDRWLGRAAPVDSTADALIEGYTLTLARVDEALMQHQVVPIECRNGAFDPHSMEAVEVEVTATVPDGTVLAVYRSGYRLAGDVYRMARVKVSRSQRVEEKEHGA